MIGKPPRNQDSFEFRKWLESLVKYVNTPVTSGTTDHAALTNKAYADSGHTGFQPAGSYLTSFTETDPVFTAHQAHNITSTHITVLNNTSGINTGDQVIPDQLLDLADDATHRLVTDTEKTTWNAKLSSFTETDPIASAALTTHKTSTDHDGRYFTEAETTSLLAAKEGTITAGAATQYYRGDKSWQTLNQEAVADLTTRDQVSLLGLITPHFQVAEYQNHLLQAEAFDNASWVKTGIGTVSANGAIDPLGSAGAENIPAGSGATSSVNQAYTNSTTGDWAFSVWAKTQSGSSTIKLRVDSNAQTGTETTFDIDTRWRRIGIVQNLTTAHTTKTVYIISGTTAVALWGACLDNNTFVRGYINTSTTRVTATARTPIFRNTISANLSGSSVTTSGGMTSTRANIVTTSTDGVVIQNSTAATAAVPVQFSPRARFRSFAWDTTTVSSETHDWVIESVPTSGATPTDVLKFGFALDSGAITYLMALKNNGYLGVGNVAPAYPLDVTGDVRSSANIYCSAVNMSGAVVATAPSHVLIETGTDGFIRRQTLGSFRANNTLDSWAAPVDVTTNNASTTAHGLLPKLNGSTTTFLNGNGAWTAPSAYGCYPLFVQQAKVNHFAIANRAREDAGLNRYYLLFDPSTAQYADFQFVMPSSYVSTMALTCTLTVTSTVASNNTVWAIAVMATTGGDAVSLETDSFDTGASLTIAMGGTIGYMTSGTATISNKDSVAAKDLVTLRIARNATNASDTNTGDAKLSGILLEWQ